MRVLTAVVALLLCGCALPPETHGAADAGSVCAPGQDQTCNDNPTVSSLMGTCQPDGTCVCREGTVVNPATGRCGPRD